MSSSQAGRLLRPARGLCGQCRRRIASSQHDLLPRRLLSTSPPRRTESQLQKLVDAASASRDSLAIAAAPPSNRDPDSVSAPPKNPPARIVPASPSYFTASPQFNDHVLLLRSLLRECDSLPTVSHDQAPWAAWLKLATYRTQIGEPVTSSKYSKLLRLLNQLNRIHPNLRSSRLRETLDLFRRPDVSAREEAPPPTLDEEGRSSGVGRRKESSAKVYLVEGNGEVLVNGKSVAQAFPRLHDRESALWALKVTGRVNKYNVFALARGGGLTGQAESVTLALARALLVHEPALKPTLRKAGCVSFDARRVERKKPGRVKARKRPTWVKR